MTKTSDNIAESAIKGIFWIGGGQVIKQIVGVLTYVLLARLLSSNDFGLMSMVMVFVGFSMLFVEFGIGAAIIHRKDLSEAALNSAFWINLAAATVLALLLAAVSPLVAWIYHKPEISPLLLALSSSLLLSGLQVIPKALLQRKLHFYPIARAEAVSSTVAAACAIFFAWRGLGVWALVLQPLIGNAMLVLMYSLGASWYPRLMFNWQEVKTYIHYSGHVFASNLLVYLNRNADDFIIGRYIGSTPLGYYTLAYQIMLYPLQQVSTIIVRVLFPSLSQLQDDIPRFRSMYLKAVSSIALITFPMMFGLFSVAENFIIVVFGEAWINMLTVLKVFCIIGMLQSVATTLGTIYLSTGKTGLMFKVNMVNTPFYIIAFIVGVPWGIEGVATSYAIVSTIIYLVSVVIAFGVVEMPVSDFFRVLARPFLISLVMAAGVIVSDRAFVGLVSDNRVWHLSADIAIGVVLYVVLSLLFNRQQINDIASKVFSTFRKKSK